VLQVQDKDRWRFLLGNTLMRMLGHLKLDQDQMQHWKLLARDQSAVSTLAASKCNSYSEEERAALEMLMVMLPEFCMLQAPALACSLIGDWKMGKFGQLRQAFAEVEFRHASAVGMALLP